MEKNYSRKIRFGLLQYQITANPQKNLGYALSLLENLAARRPHYVVLPEMWLGGPTQKRKRAKWSAFYKKTLPETLSWARQHQIGLFFSQLEENRKKFYNTAYFVDPKGKIKGTYRKIHLFKFEGETKIYSRGSQVDAIGTPFGKIGTVVCFDIRFPELIRKLANQKIKILVVMAQWPKTRVQHWLTLLKARAIENQLFVVACNRLGSKGRIRYNGHSVIISPWGKELLKLSPGQKMGLVEIDLSEVEKIRKQYPFFSEQRLP